VTPNRAVVCRRRQKHLEEEAVLFTIKVLVAGILLAIIESVFFDAIDIAGIRPDILVLAVILMSARMDFSRLLFLAFLLGLSRDFYSAGPLGMNAFVLTLTAFVLLVLEEFVAVENRVGQVVLGFSGALFYGGSMVFLKPLLQHETAPLGTLLKLLLGTSIYTAALAPALFFALRRPQALPYLRLKLRHLAEHETIPENKT
jgi:rod shape-determining protein MreD